MTRASCWPARAPLEMTVAGLIDAYLADPEKAALRSRAEIERRLRKNVVPLIGAVRVTELRRRDVRTVTDTILRRGRKVEATRVFRGPARHGAMGGARTNTSRPIRSMAWASRRRPRRSNRVLTDEEIRRLWRGLPTGPAALSCSANASSGYAS